MLQPFLLKGRFSPWSMWTYMSGIEIQFSIPKLEVSNTYEKLVNCIFTHHFGWILSSYMSQVNKCKLNSLYILQTSFIDQLHMVSVTLATCLDSLRSHQQKLSIKQDSEMLQNLWCCMHFETSPKLWCCMHSRGHCCIVKLIEIELSVWKLFWVTD